MHHKQALQKVPVKCMLVSALQRNPKREAQQQLFVREGIMKNPYLTQTP